MQAILLAAGFGTRLKPYSTLRPKPLFPVLNRPLLHLQLTRLFKSGFKRIMVNAHHLADQIEQALVGWPGVRLQYEPEILGTGGSLREALSHLADEPVLVVNGDVYHDISLEALYSHHLASGNAVTMALHDLPRFNTVQIEDDRITGFKGGAGALAFTGLHVLNPQVIAQIPPGCFFHIIDLYQQLAAANDVSPIGMMRVDGSFWRDMGTPEDYLHLHQALLQPGQWLIDPGARIADGVQLEGWGCIGAGAVVAAGVQLRDCVLWDGAQVPAKARHCLRILSGDPEIDNQTFFPTAAQS